MTKKFKTEVYDKETMDIDSKARLDAFFKKYGSDLENNSVMVPDSVIRAYNDQQITPLQKNTEQKIIKPKDLSYGKKPPITLVPPSFIIHVSKSMEDGAKKRSAYNWRTTNVSTMQLLDKVYRHLLKYQDGQDLDEESGLLELAHAAADIAVLIDAKETNSLVDDRPSKGIAGQLIRKLVDEV